MKLKIFHTLGAFSWAFLGADQTGRPLIIMKRALIKKVIIILVVSFDSKLHFKFINVPLKVGRHWVIARMISRTIG